MYVPKLAGAGSPRRFSRARSTADVRWALVYVSSALPAAVLFCLRVNRRNSMRLERQVTIQQFYTVYDIEPRN